MGGTVRKYDVFFSYNWRDRVAVEDVAQILRKKGLTVFLDRWYLVPGRPWPKALEEALNNCQAVAIFLGPHKMGGWQQREKDLALNRQARDSAFQVIPVLLPGADPALGFLSLNTWVDMQAGIDDPVAIAVLVAAVRGQAPGPELQERMKATLTTICPYRGLRAFREEDAALFFGREAFTARLGEAVAQHTMIAVVGASGCGKSSVVRAGLVPYLRRAVGEQLWDITTLSPGDRPLYSLAAALMPVLEPEMTETDRLAETTKLADHLVKKSVALRDVVDRILEKQPGTGHLLLVVDQWEELYTPVHDDQTRQRFLDELLEATAGGMLTTVLTLRGDFFGRLLSHRTLADRLQNAVVNLGPMTREELQLAIESPAGKVGLTFEPGLVGRILTDVGEEPGNLPLLEFVLTALWERRRAGMLLHEAYEAIGGVRGAMAHRADEVFGNLSPGDQTLVRRLLVHLVRPGERTEDMRRRATLTEVGQAAQPIVQQLANARLIVTGHDEATGEETVEVAHEALIHNWARLRGWLDKDREFLHWRQRLRARLEEWEDANRDEGALLRGVTLAEAERWLGERRLDIEEEARCFIEKSKDLESQREEEKRERHAHELAQAKALADEQKRRADEQTQAARRLRRFAIGLVVTVLMAGVFALFAWVQRQETIHLGRIAHARELVAQGRAEFENRPLLGLRLCLEGLALAPQYETDLRISIMSIVRDLAKEGRLWKLGDHISNIYPSPDRSLILIRPEYGSEGEIRRTTDGSLTGTLEEVYWSKVAEVSFSPDPNTTYVMISYTYDYDIHDLYSTADGSHVSTGTLVTLSSNASRYLTSRRPEEDVSTLYTDDTTFDVTHDYIEAAKFSPDPNATYFVIVCSDTSTELRRTADNLLITPLESWPDHVSFSPDATYLVDDIYDLNILRTVNGEIITKLVDKAPGNEISGIEFDADPNTTYLLIEYQYKPSKPTLNNENKIIVRLVGEIHWDEISGKEFKPDPDATYCVIDRSNSPSQVGHAVGGSPVGSTLCLVTFKTKAALSPPKNLPALADADRLLKGVCSNLGKDIVFTFTDKVHQVFFSPYAIYFIIAYKDHIMSDELRRTVDGKVITTFMGKVEEVFYSPGGTHFVVTFDDRDMPNELRRTVDGKVVASFIGKVEEVFFSPDGTCFVVGFRFPREAEELRRTSDGVLIAKLVGCPSVVDQVSFSPDGTYFVVDYELFETMDERTSDDVAGELRTIDGTLITKLVGCNEIDGIFFSPDGTYFVVDYENGRSEIWDRRNRTCPLIRLDLGRMGHVFDPSGQRLVVWYSDGQAHLLDLTWLAAMQGDPAALSGEKLVRLAYEGPLATGLLDEVDLKQYLEEGKRRPSDFSK